MSVFAVSSFRFQVLDIAFTLKRLACGLDSPQVAPEITWNDNQWKADLQSAYGNRCEPEPASSPPSVTAAPPSVPTLSVNPSPPRDEKRDLTLYAMVIGAHGFRCLQRMDTQ